MDKVYFTINGEKVALSGSEVSQHTSLNDYLRNYLNLFGTKAMCHEGGCGACVVSVSVTHPASKERQVFAVNSCLVHVLSCHQWDITTVEGVGNRRDGYHSIQQRLAAFNGTQCGYCTPGWVMNMYSLYESSNQKLTMQKIENSFGGNMCRCTGYRPILDAFKSFATDADEALKSKVQDMEDLDKGRCTKKCRRKCSVAKNDWCVIEHRSEELLHVDMGNNRWYKAYTVQDVFKVLSREGNDSYRLVAGNTGKGVFPIATDARVLIDISSITGLKETYKDVNLVFGAGMSLTELMAECQRWSHDSDFRYLEQFYKHLDLVAHVPVRNIGTIGGNLAMKAAHHDFPSDIFLLLETVGATVTMVNNKLEKSDVIIQDFLKLDLKDKMILNVKLPPLSEKIHVITYKIMPRVQNAHALLNAGFLFEMDASGVITKCTLAFGNVRADFGRARRSERALTGLAGDAALAAGLAALEAELQPAAAPPEPSPACRKRLALGLLYKTLLRLAGEVGPRVASGAAALPRPPSRGAQTFDTDKSLWPLNEPVAKLEALAQCSGEARYSCDVNTSPREVHVAFVLSTVCVGEIDHTDATEVLKLPGVVSFLTAKDIPGKNSFTPTAVPWQASDEEIFASKKISYYGQPIGVIAAVTHKLALKAAGMVKVQYKNVGKPVLSIEEALVAPDKDRRIREEISIKPTNKGVDTTQVLTGTFRTPSQYHYTMETQCCTVSNTERGLTVRSSTQWMDLVQVAVSQALGLQENEVLVSVSRVGGAYGGKASRSALCACACALVARALGRSATLVMPIADNMAAVGKRQACRADYEIGINNDGVIQYVELKYYSDCGYSFNDSSGSEVAGTLTNLYETSRWSVAGHSVLTDTHSNTWCRAPATTEGTAILEHIMQRIAHATKKDSTAIRIQHLAPKHESVKELLLSFKNDIKYDERKADIHKYNSENAWKKQGLEVSVMSYPIGYSWNFPVTVSVYHADGTVMISHGGIEMGQGINTKVAQVCAYTLKVELNKVAVKGSDSFVSPNAMVSNGSITSECVAFATVKACKELLERMEPARSELNEPTWEEVVKVAFKKGINLQASYMTSDADALQGYTVYGACAAQVELDVLTGTHVLTRVELLEDTGVSLSPGIDVGQIEGAFIMGLGLWTSENLVYDSSGRLLTDRTWSYKPPGARDIPSDFRVSFKRNSVNSAGVLRSKATGEPALTLAVVVTHALREAIVEARTEFGHKDSEWVHIDTPFSVENILEAIAPKAESYKIL